MDSKTVLEYFKEITRIPRESGHEGPITAYLQEFAASHGLDCRTDVTGNVLITRPASKGREDVPVIVLQSHQDMVCEKNAGVIHDFSKDPIRYEIEDGWMIARDTTLGADDGIGIASELALLASDQEMGRIECLFTISEETGMDGAEALQPGFFSGKTLINLDSEDEGQLFIGCSGGMNTKVTFRYEEEEIRPDYKVLKLVIDGAAGGHSGDDINKERANAVQLMARFLYSEYKRGMQLVSINGGNKPNAIARECSAVVAVPRTSRTRARFLAFGEELKVEYAVSDPDVRCHVESASAVRTVDTDTAGRIISSLFGCPHGVQAMSQDIAGLVETSTNLASVRMIRRGIVEIGTSQRSSILSERMMIGEKVEAVFKMAGADVKQQYAYPGWKPDLSSHILSVCVESYRRLFGQEPEVKAIHAGLECGLFLEKFPDLDMISFGPTLRGVHAPGEKLELASLDKFVALLDDVVCNFK